MLFAPFAVVVNAKLAVVILAKDEEKEEKCEEGSDWIPVH